MQNFKSSELREAKAMEENKKQQAYEAELVKQNAALTPPKDPVEWKVFRIFQRDNDDYDTYDDAIVVAKSEGDARMIHPSGKPNEDTSSEVERMERWLRRVEINSRFSDPLGPLPGWYSPEWEDWVRPAFVNVEFVSSFDGDPKFHNSVIVSSYRGC